MDRWDPKLFVKGCLGSIGSEEEDFFWGDLFLRAFPLE